MRKVIQPTALIGIALFLALSLAQFTLAHPVSAANPQPPDPCSAPVGSVPLLIRGGSETPQWVLRGGRNIFSLSLYPAARNPAALPWDTPGVFSFERGVMVYIGLLHAFRHGTRQHLCFSGPVYMVKSGGHGHNSAQTIPIRLDGTKRGNSISVMLVVAHAVYWVYGITSHV